jgi:hypothetical protein
MGRDEAEPPRRSVLRLLPLAGVGAALVLAVALWFWDWNRVRPLQPSGGLPIPWRIALRVPPFRQADPRWADDRLGPTDGRLAAEGCAVASAAMVLGHYGVETDPGALNRFLQARGGYTENGWIYWEKAAEMAPETIRFAYEDLPSHALIDRNLLRGNPVIARLRYPQGVTHFVVISGKRGFDYLVTDPGRGSAKGVYPLKEFGSPIEAIRFYERIFPH